MHLDRYRRAASLAAVPIALLIAAPMPAQTATTGSPAATRIGPREILPRDVEITLARSAAPPGVSARARVLVLTDSGFVVAEPGSSGVTCLVDRSWSLSIEPHCYDAEGAASILPMFVRRTELSHLGASEAEIDREIADGLASGRFRLPRRPALTYMMSAAQVLYDDDGRLVGHWRPHLMMYYPYMTNAELGLPATPDMSVGSVFDEGTPRASLVIVMPEFVSAPAVATRPPDR
jgi:hypothetical protein